MQFSDLNEDFQPFQRQYTSDIIKIQEIERQIKAIEEQLGDYSVPYDGQVDTDRLQEAQRPANTTQIGQSIGKDVNDSYKRLTEQATAEHQLRAELSSQEVFSRFPSMYFSRKESGNRFAQTTASAHSDQSKKNKSFALFSLNATKRQPSKFCHKWTRYYLNKGISSEKDLEVGNLTSTQLTQTLTTMRHP